jgi:hypothetical protein
MRIAPPDGGCCYPYREGDPHGYCTVFPATGQPTTVAPLPRLLASTQSLGLERHFYRPKRGLPTLVLALVWLVLAWRGNGRPQHLDDLDATRKRVPRLAALLGDRRLPWSKTSHRSLAHFAAHAVRRAVEAAHLAEPPRRAGRAWAAIAAHQLPYHPSGRARHLPGGAPGHRDRRASDAGRRAPLSPPLDPADSPLRRLIPNCQIYASARPPVGTLIHRVTARSLTGETVGLFT